MTQWELNRKKNPGPKPVRPQDRYLFIPADTFSSSVYDTLSANGGCGLLFDTETDTFVKITNIKDFGDFTDVLRKLFHHEAISMFRKTDHVRIVIHSPRMSVLLTGTPNQVIRLFRKDNVENGFASRFDFYFMPKPELHFRDVWMRNKKPLDQIFEAMSDKVLKFFHALQAQADRPVEFLLSEEQKHLFNETFENVLQEQAAMLGEDIQGFIKRHGLICFRIAMVLTMLRRLSEWDGEGQLFDGHQAIVCSPTDYRLAMVITNCLVNHLAVAYDEFEKDRETPFYHNGEQPSASAVALYQALPAGKELSTKDVVEVGLRIGLPRRTVERTLKDLVVRHHAMTRIRTGIYLKPDRTNPSDAEDSTSVS